MKITLFLTLEQVLLIHEDMIDRYGGSSGIRDIGLLESAVFRPQSSFGGEDLYPTRFDKAAALIHSLLKNHAFLDGNKRTATASMLIFLELNDLELDVKQDQLVDFAMKVENEDFSLEDIASWLQHHTTVQK